MTTGCNDKVARGKDALTVLDNPATRFIFMDELYEVSTCVTRSDASQTASELLDFLF